MIVGLGHAPVPKRALPGHAATTDNIARVGDSLCRAVVAFVSRKSKNNTEIATSSVSGPTERRALFGPPLLLPDEDAAACDELLGRICAVVKPADIIDEMFIADVVSLEWEVLRWRRLKWRLLQSFGFERLQELVAERLDHDHYALYQEYFADDLAETLKENLPEEEQEGLQTLARKSAQNDPDADEKVHTLLASIGVSMGSILDGARDRKAEELVQRYMRGEPDTVMQIDEFLVDAGKSMDGFIVDVLAENLDTIERIDRLIAIAEDRRNASLHEIDRRRVLLGEKLRRTVQEVEDAEFKVIETPPGKRTTAA
jgi:hypothetical protein